MRQHVSAKSYKFIRVMLRYVLLQRLTLLTVPLLGTASRSPFPSKEIWRDSEVLKFQVPAPAENPQHCARLDCPHINSKFED
jgi:hypothetical protein